MTTDTLTNKELTNLVVSLAQRCKQLEEKVDMLYNNNNNSNNNNASNDEEDVVTLNHALIPAYILQEMSELIQLKESDIEYLFTHSFFETFERIVVRNIQEKQKQVPLNMVKNKILMMYDMKDHDAKEKHLYIWQPLDLKTLQVFINKFHMKLCKYFYNWCQTQPRNEESDSNMDKTLVKLMKIETQKENVIKQVKKILYKIFEEKI